MKTQINFSENEFPFKDDFFQLMLNSINESFVLVGKDLVIIQSNKAAQTGIWKQAGMLLYPGNYILDFVEENRKPLLKELFHDTLNGFTRKTEYTYLHNGSIMYFENTMIPARNSENEIFGVIIYSNDITEKRKLN